MDKRERDALDRYLTDEPAWRTDEGVYADEPDAGELAADQFEAMGDYYGPDPGDDEGEYDDLTTQALRHREAARKANLRQLRFVLLWPFLLGLAVVVWQCTREQPEWVLVWLAVVPMLPLLCTYDPLGLLGGGLQRRG